MPKAQPDPDWMEVVKRRVRAHIARWTPLLGLSEWDIDVQWKPGGEADSGSDFGTMLQVEAKWEYMSASIDVYCSAVRHADDDALEDFVVHELMHCIVNEMRECATEFTDKDVKHEERVVSILTSAVLAVRRDAMERGVRKGRRLAAMRKRRAKR